MITVKSRVHRTLRHMSGFTYCSEIDGIFARYSNESGEPTAIDVAETGLFLRWAASTRFVAFADIVDVISPDSKTDTRLKLHLLDGAIVELDIRGGNARCLDVFEWVRFLSRILEDLVGSPEPK